MLKLFVTGFALAVSAGAFADARQALDRFADGLDTLSGSFSQVTLEPDGSVLEENSGELFYAQPDRFRWRYSEPFPQELVADGEQLWHYDESLEQVTVRDQPPAGESTLLVLTRPELLDRFYSIEAGDAADQLRFRPLHEDAEFEQATLFMRDDQPVRLELVDRFDQLTRLELHDLVRNPDLDDAMFEFSPPEGVDVLEGY